MVQVCSCNLFDMVCYVRLELYQADLVGSFRFCCMVTVIKTDLCL